MTLNSPALSRNGRAPTENIPALGRDRLLSIKAISSSQLETPSSVGERSQLSKSDPSTKKDLSYERPSTHCCCLSISLGEGVIRDRDEIAVVLPGIHEVAVVDH